MVAFEPFVIGLALGGGFEWLKDSEFEFEIVDQGSDFVHFFPGSVFPGFSVDPVFFAGFNVSCVGGDGFVVVVGGC
jgi:hypothetical protein